MNVDSQAYICPMQSWVGEKTSLHARAHSSSTPKTITLTTQTDFFLGEICEKRQITEQSATVSVCQLLFQCKHDGRFTAIVQTLTLTLVINQFYKLAINVKDIQQAMTICFAWQKLNWTNIIRNKIDAPDFFYIPNLFCHLYLHIYKYNMYV